MSPLALSLVALLVACEDGAPAHEHDAGLGDASLDPDAGVPTLRIVRMEPSEVPLRGGTAVVHFADIGAGLIGYPLVVLVNGVPTGRWPLEAVSREINVPPAAAAGPIDLAVGTGSGFELGRLDDAGRYVERPAMPALLTSLDQFASPLPPELASPCVRRGFVYVGNAGDAPFAITSTAIADDPAFTIESAPCAGIECAIRICFSSEVPGTHAGRLVVATTAGTVEQPLVATVLDVVPEIDPAFRSTLVHGPTRAAAVLGDGLAVGTALGWAEDLQVRHLRADGSESVWELIPPVIPVGRRSVQRVDAIVATPDRAAVYVAVRYWESSLISVLRFTEAGHDASFGRGGIVDIASEPGTIAELAVTADGVVLVTGYQNVHALAPDGTFLRGFDGDGTRRVAADPPAARVATDSRGNAYVHFYEGFSHRNVLDRYSLGDGAIDPAFRYAGTHLGVPYVDRADRLLLAVGADLWPVEADGNVGPAVFSDAEGRAIRDVAFDAAGRTMILADDRLLGPSGETLGRRGVARVVCPPAGGCWVITTIESETWVSRLRP